ncbi:hypothetical protein Tco_1345367 [Tanacetum coccineum]
MMTYLKNMGGFKHSQLKGKSYEEIQGLYERQQKRIKDFTLMDSEKEAQKPGKRLKRVAGSYATQKSPKKPKVMKFAKDVIEEEAVEYEKEKKELRISLKIIPNYDSEVDYEPLFKKFPIVNWEYQLLGKIEAKHMYVYKLTRAGGSSSYHGDTQAFLRRLDRQDLNDLYRLVQERFQDYPLEGYDLLLWGDLRMIFNPDEKDELWMNQLDWKLLKWKLYEVVEFTLCLWMKLKKKVLWHLSLSSSSNQCLDKEKITIDAIPLATKPLMIVEYKIVKEGQKGFYHLIRADGSSKRYSSMIKMLQNIDREDLETLWNLVKDKHENTRPEDDYKRVLWGDLKVMFEPDIKNEVWRSLQGYKVTVWKLFDNFSAASSKVNAASLNCRKITTA